MEIEAKDMDNIISYKERNSFPFRHQQSPDSVGLQILQCIVIVFPFDIATIDAVDVISRAERSLLIS